MEWIFCKDMLNIIQIDKDSQLFYKKNPTDLMNNMNID